MPAGQNWQGRAPWEASAGLGLVSTDPGSILRLLAPRFLRHAKIQTDRFGTPLSKSLGTFSDALRTQRRQQAEEAAAKTTIKLVPPLVFFIFPNIAITTVVPAILVVMKNIGHIVD